MTEIATSIEWSDQLEHYFASTGEKCYALNWCHHRAAVRYSRLKNYTDLPVIILGVLNGSISVGSSSLFNDPKMASVGVGAIALLTAILSTISSYFKWAQRAEAHRIGSLHYAKIYRFVAIQMGLPRTERMSPSDLLRHMKDNFDRLAEICPILPSEVIAEFKNKFDTPEYKELAKPSECNGLEAIEVYHPHVSPPISPIPTQLPRAVSSESQFYELPQRPPVRPTPRPSLRSELGHSAPEVAAITLNTNAVQA
jgi:hypothetical protein